MAKLNEKQVYAIELLTQFPQTQTYEQIAEQVGVSVATLRNWRNKNEMFADEMLRQAKRNALEDLPRVMGSVPDMIINGENAAMLRTWLQYIGALTDKVEVTTKGANDVSVDDIKAQIEALKKNDE